MANSPTITAILTCFREGALLREAADSLLSQTYKAWHCVVVNDASPDAQTNAICAELEQSPKFIVLLNPANIGLSGSRNVAIAQSEGELFLCLDGDDRLPDKSLQSIAHTFRADPSLDFVYGDFREFGNGDCIHQPGPLSLEGMLLSQPIDGHSPFRRHVWETVGGFPSELSWGNQDWDFWLSIFEHGFRGKYLPEVLYEWRIRDGSMHKSYEDRWPQICEYMYHKHKSTYDRYGKASQFLGGGWRRAALYHYRCREYAMALECAEKALRFLPDDNQMKRIRWKCLLPRWVLRNGQRFKAIYGEKLQEHRDHQERAQN
jgi:glycosyltransferase involved in cell wall biosynthesis